MGDLQGKVRTSPLNPPSVEKVDAFVDRALGWWDSSILPMAAQLDQDTEKPINALVVGHGAYIAYLARALGTERGYDVSKATTGRVLNASITLVEVRKDGKGALVKYADAAHLREEALVKVNADDVDIKTGHIG